MTQAIMSDYLTTFLIIYYRQPYDWLQQSTLCEKAFLLIT